MSTSIQTARRERIRELIRSAGGRFASVEFVKRDGTVRVMQVQPACDRFHVKGEAGCPSGRQGAATRALSHPELMPIFDVKKKAFRSINLDTVRKVRVDGLEFEVVRL